MRRRAVVTFMIAVGLVGTSLLLPADPAHAEAIYSEQQGHHGANTFTNYHNASSEGPAIAAASWVAVSCKVYDPYIKSANPNGNWYRIASSPWNDQYYAAANTFMNGDPWGGPYTHNTDFAVPDCGSNAAPAPAPTPQPAPPTAPVASSPAQAPAPAPSVYLTQGPTAPSGYRYSITLNGFPASTSVSISCHDSANPGGFYTFGIKTDSGGHAFTQSQCYSADGPDHWVTARGAESNHVTWSRGSGPVAGGGSGGSLSSGGPDAGSVSGAIAGGQAGSSSIQQPPAPAAAARICEAPSGTEALNDIGKTIPAVLLQHYLAGHGTPVFLDWRYFSGSAGFASIAKSLPVGGTKAYEPPGDSTLYQSVGEFTVCRISTNLYAAYDHYDFTPDKKSNYPFYPLWLLTYLDASNFAVYSSGNL